jgi:hypothetical protein
VQNVAEQVRKYFAEIDTMYADLIKMMMVVNEARDESFKHFLKN